MFGIPTDSILHEIQNSISILQNSKEFSGSTRKMISGSLNNGCGFKTKTALYYLKSVGILTQKEIRAWNAVRNQMLHADHIEGDGEFQKIFDRTYICLGMFYKIVFITIGYSGLCLNYEKFATEEHFKNPFSWGSLDLI